MPTAVIRDMAKDAGKSVAKSEELWEKASGIAEEKFDTSDEGFYPYTMGIFKRMMGLSSAAFVSLSNTTFYGLTHVEDYNEY